MRDPFQSTPDLVNRENMPTVGGLKASLLFQSTPDLVNRENTTEQTREIREFVFQSTPDLVNRENRGTANHKKSGQSVSIHSRFS